VLNPNDGKLLKTCIFFSIISINASCHSTSLSNARYPL